MFAQEQNNGKVVNKNKMFECAIVAYIWKQSGNITHNFRVNSQCEILFLTIDKHLSIITKIRMLKLLMLKRSYNVCLSMNLIIIYK